MTRKIFILSLCLLFLVPSACIATSTSTVIYSMTEEELTTLENTLTQQQITIIKLLNTVAILKLDSTEAKEQLIIAEHELSKALEESVVLKQEVVLLKMDLKNSNQALARANQSLTEYAKEVNKKVNKLKIQRNIAYVIAISAIVRGVSK